MKKKGGIPVSISMDGTPHPPRTWSEVGPDKRRILFITILAVLSAVVISVVAKGMVLLIDLITNIAFHGSFTFDYLPPGVNNLGWWVVLVPVLGGVLVGVMALYGSKAIRGHGIPEAMEMILTNKSKIKPAITYLKPLSAALSIGTGGPFGAEGPIISTGGALGSMVGQLLRISPNERKVLLAAGATSGMAAIFGSPIAAVFLAVELLLFEFAPRSLLPVFMGCITGAAGHHLLFGSAPMFAMPAVAVPSNAALFGYSVMGLVIGLLSILITKAVYLVEDGFEKLPIHWMWWPAIGGIAVGVIGYISPRTLGVGYENITQLLSGDAPMKLILGLALFKLLSWGIALGSGTSGGTLAPMMTVGGAVGCLLGMLAQMLFPSAGFVLPMAVLVGMSAMFAGASRAVLTSVVFALETTGRIEALLPLLSACACSYLVSYFLMTNTIMTEKIARRGIRTPDSYEPDVLEQIGVEQVMEREAPVVSGEMTKQEVLRMVPVSAEHLIVSDHDGGFVGLANRSDILLSSEGTTMVSLARTPFTVSVGADLRTAAGMLARTPDHAPVVVTEQGTIVGLITYNNVIEAYGTKIKDDQQVDPNILLSNRRLRIMVQGRKLYERVRGRS